MWTAQEWVDGVAVGYVGEHREADLGHGQYCRPQDGRWSTYVLSGPEDGPVAPWIISGVWKPCAQVRIADNQWQHRRSEFRLNAGTQHRERNQGGLQGAHCGGVDQRRPKPRKDKGQANGRADAFEAIAR